MEGLEEVPDEFTHDCDEEDRDEEHSWHRDLAGEGPGGLLPPPPPAAGSGTTTQSTMPMCVGGRSSDWLLRHCMRVTGTWRRPGQVGRQYVHRSRSATTVTVPMVHCSAYAWQRSEEIREHKIAVVLQ